MESKFLTFSKLFPENFRYGNGSNFRDYRLYFIKRSSTTIKNSPCWLSLRSCDQSPRPLCTHHPWRWHKTTFLNDLWTLRQAVTIHSHSFGKWMPSMGRDQCNLIWWILLSSLLTLPNNDPAIVVFIVVHHSGQFFLHLRGVSRETRQVIYSVIDQAHVLFRPIPGWLQNQALDFAWKLTMLYMRPES